MAKIVNRRLVGRFINPETGRPVNVHKGRKAGYGVDVYFYYRSGAMVPCDPHGATKWEKAPEAWERKAPKMKQFDGTLRGRYHATVAAPSKKRAAELLKMPISAFNNYFRETNESSVTYHSTEGKLAREMPEVVFMRGRASKKIIRLDGGEVPTVAELPPAQSNPLKHEVESQFSDRVLVRVAPRERGHKDAPDIRFGRYSHYLGEWDVEGRGGTMAPLVLEWWPLPEAGTGKQCGEG